MQEKEGYLQVDLRRTWQESQKIFDKNATEIQRIMTKEPNNAVFNPLSLSGFHLVELLLSQAMLAKYCRRHGELQETMQTAQLGLDKETFERFRETIANVVPGEAPKIGQVRQGKKPVVPANIPSLPKAEEISLVKVGGVYEIPVEINGVLTLNFILDSEAAEVNIPADVVLTLVRAGTIKETDFLPGKTYVLADGSELRSPRFIIRSLKVGSRQITNVAASVDNLTSNLLLGQSLLEKLGTWGIDSQRKVLIINSGASQAR